MSMFVRFLFFDDFLSILFRKAWWPPAGKELSTWFSALAVFILCRPNCMYSFPICLGQDVEFDCIGFLSLPFHLLCFGCTTERCNGVISHTERMQQRFWATVVQLVVFINTGSQWL